jgi:hypothetical protein
MKQLVLFAVLALANHGWHDTVSAATPEKEEQLFEAGSFENPKVCAGCHREIHQAWSRSMHAYAWQDKWYQADYQTAHKESGGATDMLCGACHAPIAARTGQLPPHDGSKFDSTSQQGISCDFCHTVSGVEQVYNMGHVSSPGSVKRGPRGDGSSLYHEVEYSDIHTRAEFCGSCHNVIHPATGVVIIDTYDDWRQNEYGRNGVRCQDCHMTPTPGIGKNPGRAAGMGLKRESVAFHAFAGASSYVQDHLGHEEQARMAREVLKAAAILELAEQVGKDGALELTVDVHNVGAGHKIPTGVPYIRKMWLQVEVLDAGGKQVYSSGHLTGNNHVDPEAVFFRLLFLDDKGELTGKSWRARAIGYDRRIPANGREREVYRIELPARGAYTVNARLMYRSFSQETMDRFQQTSGGSLPPLESVEMARATITVAY